MIMDIKIIIIEAIMKTIMILDTIVPTQITIQIIMNMEKEKTIIIIMVITEEKQINLKK